MTFLPSFKLAAAAALTFAIVGCAQMAAPSTASMPTPIAPGAAPAAGKVGVLWLGQSAFKITTPTGKVIVIDPWLTANPKTPAQYKKLEALGKVDLILVTHGHGDHYLDAPAIAKMYNAPLWAPAGLAQSMQTLGVLPVAQANRMNKGGSIRPFGPDGVRITMTHAEHSSELVWRNPATDKDETHVGGEPCGFVIEFENGFKLWHLGDTGVYGDMKLLGQLYKPDLLLIPIGGGQFVMNPADAAMATRDLIQPKMAIPMHYGTNPSLVGTPAEYSNALASSSGNSSSNAPVKVLAINPGDALEF